MSVRFALGAAAASVLTATASLATTLPPATLADCREASHLTVLNAQPALPEAFAEARAVWLDAHTLRWPGEAAAGAARVRLVHAARSTLVIAPGAPVHGADDAITLVPRRAPLPEVLAQRFRHVGAGATYDVPEADRARVGALLRGQAMLVEEDAAGRVLRATATQHAAALDALFADAAAAVPLGAAVGRERSAPVRVSVWAPTASRVALCLHADAQGPASAIEPMARDDASGTWAAALDRRTLGHGYRFLVDVHQPGLGLVRHRVTDPYALALTADSALSVIVDLDAPATKPPGWDRAPRPPLPAFATDLSIYELHVRDFSLHDTTVPQAQRGRYAAFTTGTSRGMRHLKLLQRAGVTDVHLLPVFDIATIPERGCVAPRVPDPRTTGPATRAQQDAVMREAARDCFNWGYDPLHFTVPEGSYASDAADPLARIREFRAMVMALHRAGLRVGMDVVYNHTSASGADPKSVLDRLVPGYYHRLDAAGRVERSTCCENTATEHRMMGRLMIDSAVDWVRHYRIDSFRFDLMGHQPKAEMLELQRAVNAVAGRHVHLIGEGWNFGEVKDGARFVQAAQLPLAGSGIGTFSDRARDAVRGGGCCDSGVELIRRQGWASGLHADRNAEAVAAGLGTRDELLRTADLVRAGLAGTLAGYRLTTADGAVRTLAELDYAGGPAGYVAEPGEVVNYVENHDNPTLFDALALKLPRTTTREDRVRAQLVAAATTAFSQGIAYWHAGIEILRSKSLDRNSYDSGDWFNRLDWTLTDNGFGAGLPPERDNGRDWALLAPVLADASIKPRPADIRFARDAFVDLLRIRASSRLFRLPTAEAVRERLRFLDTGPRQSGSTIVGHLDGRGLEDARFDEVLYAINAAPAAATIELPELKGRRFVLHPVQRASNAADARPRLQARWEPEAARLLVPARTALVLVIERR